MKNYYKYIYLDSKILGTARQIAVYFENKIFSSTDTLILIKKYKHKSAKQIAKIFDKNGLKYAFIKMGDLDKLEQGVIFYPFNAQSNVRAVANRKLKHIFITHGESNKVASIKPIIRIYDYVAMAGQAGVERFLNHAIFTEHDVQRGRLLKMGDTFIGQTGLSSNNEGIPCVFYAPTWEGGIKQENYSSLSYIALLGYVLSTLCQKHNIKHIIIQPHPNTGHRLKIYKQHFFDLIKKLNKLGLNVVVLEKFKLSFWEKRALKKNNVKIVNKLSEFYAVEGICDISAMETQFLNENIPYYLFWNRTKHPKTLFFPEKYKLNEKLFSQGIWYFWEVNTEFESLDNYKKYVIDENMSLIPLEHRINALLNKIS